MILSLEVIKSYKDSVNIYILTIVMVFGLEFLILICYG